MQNEHPETNLNILDFLKSVKSLISFINFVCSALRLSQVLQYNLQQTSALFGSLFQTEDELRGSVKGQNKINKDFQNFNKEKLFTNIEVSEYRAVDEHNLTSCPPVN